MVGRAGQPPADRRGLGQFFTPSAVAALTCAATMDADTRSVLDPTCGPGRMLWAAVAHGRRIGIDDRLRVLGVEIDPVLATLARVPLGPAPHRRVEVVEGDAFAHAAGLGTRVRVARAHDAVIGNPPYVRYQALACVAARSDRALMRAAARAFPGRPASRRMDALIRACLIAPLVDVEAGADVERLRALAERLADPSRVPDPVAQLFTRVVAGYSGLSDLSVPTWLLAWVMARPGGRIGFVASESGDRREYGRLLRYFQLRFLQPLLVVEPADTRWFPAARVPASLQVYRVRPAHEIAVPLADRREDAELVRVRLPADPEWAHTRALARRLERGGLEATRGERIRVRALERELLSPASRGRREDPLNALEHGTRPGASGQLSLVGSLSPPPEVARRLQTTSYTLLADIGVHTHQGLRTGCNPFFYLERAADGRARAQASVGGVSLEATPFEPVVRRQRDLVGRVVRASELPWLAFVAGRRARARDIGALADQPAAWRDAWSRAGLRTLPDDVARWIDAAERTRLVIRGRSRAIPALSAVATNVRAPGATRRDGVGSPPSWWYTLALAPRHRPPLFLARVTHDAPVAALNDPRAPALVDSNFITFTLDDSAPSAPALLAFLASTYVAACVELLGTPLGGGALKIEASQVRRLPVPALAASEWARLDGHGSALARAGGRDAATIAAIDAVLVPTASGRTALDRIARRCRRARRRRATTPADRD